MQIHMKVFYKLILTFQVCLARLTQSIHNSSIWLGIIQQKNSCFELEEKGLFPYQTRIKELIVSQKLP